MSRDPIDDFDQDTRTHTVRVTVEMDIKVDAPSGSSDSDLAECVTDVLGDQYFIDDVSVVEIELKEVE